MAGLDASGHQDLCASCHGEIRGANKASGRAAGSERGDFGDVLTVPDGSIAFDGGEKDDGLVTTNGVLPAQFTGQFNAFERVVLLASGNLQSLVSAWFARPVCVKVMRNAEVPNRAGAAGHLFDRVVEIHVEGKGLFATAHSAVNVHSDAVYTAVKTGGIGLGQLFRSLDSMPRFTLLGAGRPAGGGLWRLYELHAPAISVRILETFPADMLAMLS
eukprot:TRINITY_DN24977_c0_g1_i1.p1 TRINITY_DN24977_c0_g1~~TRINITY_DN24977_c0_g1_i1.p1  ORF type:complete len:232 (+),score=72.92 TRINITY_DN24977_c0_g1_i1:49-696(+)